ncbi:ferredoxin [Actinomadura darangshiensis]|uniref:Ferredoxin n=1 Tax=Actinomadura darangshiensis TaxID=705336 RepID=A0A4R5C3B5_9ACTN|nr:2Fe-2S iron-sulfur cluster-binding protein [Actinomadura darangshiensis]TDD92543.1 ferredoxin [Actinomadura darangshiensis]
MTGSFRTASGGTRIDRSRTLTFTFDGTTYTAHPGDTLASALLAHGVRVVAQGPYTGRPRGVYSTGAEEPNAFVQVESGPGEPMVRATRLEVHDGLRASSLSGRGRLVDAPDTGRYDKVYAHCDVLVIGAGTAGRAAALAAVAAGARVIVADDRPGIGIEASGELTVLPRTTVTGHYDHGYFVAVERRTDHLGDAAPARTARRRLWHVRARRVVLATGALERPVLFPDNDRPGIMLAGAAAAYVRRYGVLPGRRAVVFGAHDGALQAALDLLDAGVEIACVTDVRASTGPLGDRLRERGVTVLEGRAVTGTESGPDGILTDARIGGDIVPCDLLAVSGGWNPDLHLFTQAGGRTRWSAEHAAFIPGAPPRVPIDVVGSARGIPGEAAEHLPEGADGLVFVDLHRDATLAGVRDALQAGMTSNEHVKRYTTIGTGADQGRTSGVPASGALARLLGRAPGEIGTTTQRPPVEPIPFAVLAGRDRGDLLAPARRTPMHGWHEEHGALFEDVGEWKRPRYYPRPGESMDDAVLRECRTARARVAALDASTLGKIDVQGPDAAAFLDRIYTGRISTLAPGRCRYGVMCGTDGMIFDDGVAARLAPGRFHLTTTSGNAARVLDWLEEWLQTEWPELRVRCTSVTDQWAVVALAGPRSRDVLTALAPGLDVAAFPFMATREAEVAGLPARVFRISYSGELAYEINVPSWHGLALWEAVMAAGEPHGIAPYGTETMHVLRAEKGYIVAGQDTDGTVTPHDAGLGWAVKAAGGWVGHRSLHRPDTARADRKRLVGLRPRDPAVVLAEGAQLVAEPPPAEITHPVPMLGHVTSSYRGTVGSFALALLKGGDEREGETLYAVDSGRADAVTVTSPVHYDREGARRDGDG